MEHELPQVLDGADEPVTVEELEAVVHRVGQRRRATLVAGAAALLLSGAVAGALVRGPVGDDATGFAGGSEAAPPPQPPTAGMAHPTAVAVGPQLTPLFRREANGVAIRAYRSSWGAGDGMAEARCAPPATIHGELSNGAAVGFAIAPTWNGDAFTLLGAGWFGQQEGEPLTWATVRAGAGVSTVRLRVGGATDEMVPIEGITLLTVPGIAGDGAVDGLDGGGKIVASQPLSQLSPPPIDPACLGSSCAVDGAGHGGPTAAAPTDAKAMADTARARAELPQPGSPGYGEQSRQIDTALAEMEAKLGQTATICENHVVPLLPPPDVVPGPAGRSFPSTSSAPPATAAATTSTSSPNQAP